MRASLFAILAALIPSPVATLHAADPARPNVLFIYTDDQSCDALSIVQKEQGEKCRFPWLKTPHLDRLAAEGVGTADAKLIKYPRHKAWTELFDLKADPYEIRNLVDDPAAAALKEKMLAEHDRLSKEVGYRVPPFVSRPPN